MTTKVTQENSIKKTEKSIRISDWKASKEKLAHHCIDNEQAIINMSVNIGDIFECFIGENVGEEQCNERPVLVVSKSLYNKSSGRVTVVPLSKNIRTKVVQKQGQSKTVLKVQTHLKLNKSQFPFLDSDSVAICEQVRTISKARLSKRLGSINYETSSRIKNKLKLLLDMK
ncbi:type II toxin-antitoxin system PemK/MazF family toxin [Sporosarcina sp. P20a]|uniref:type II toxin-antitoxin system PemK/MazF family toxin n=1 Tax=Sporosarcina sp. P20a TaxID=2048256 RepID=UPI0013042FA7|nr:type II toxin-antitoxin system PemK/MazF family toxin [Sporosarcina sp. P20a]